MSYSNLKACVFLGNDLVNIENEKKSKKNFQTLVFVGRIAPNLQQIGDRLKHDFAK